MRLEQSEPQPAIAVLVVDDHPAVRQGLELLLAQEGVTVVAEAGNRAEALLCAADRCIDAALVDLSLGPDDGVEVVRDLRGLGVPVLVYSMHEDPAHVRCAFEAGAGGYVTKREAYQILVSAIANVAAGRRFVSPRAAEALVDLVTHQVAADPADDLSEQERQVYHLMGRGEGTVEIAATLRIGSRTVESYYARIQAKLGLDGMRALRRHAIAHAAPVMSSSESV
jgi:DNA-binding NarL/FixJ family response regulator